jgi:hypothetical protein
MGAGGGWEVRRLREREEEEKGRMKCEGQGRGEGGIIWQATFNIHLPTP